jgi:hypothetical protein
MTDDDVLEAMDRFGGSFVQALARCWRCADERNRRILQDAFAAYWTHYAEIAVQSRKVQDR